MKIDGFKCDGCNKEWHAEPMRVGRLPEGWFSLVKGDSGLVEQEKYFCSIECLVNWASVQTVYSRKIDDYFRLEKENCFNLINYMHKKGWDAEFKIRKGLDNDRWEQFQATKDNQVIHIDSSLFRGMTVDQMCKYIDQYICKHIRS